MGRRLDTIVRELNPAHDLEGFTFQSFLDAENSDEIMEAFRKNLAFIPYIVKPFARGSVIGGTMGAIGGYCTGHDPGQGFATAGLIGAFLDCSQYGLRGLYLYTKEQINPSE